MNKLILFVLIFLFCFSAYAQVSYDPGYFINNEGKRVEALIRNADKFNSPTSVEYKLSESAETRTASIDSIQEFEIVNTSHKYKRFIVDVAQAKTSTKDLDYSREPIFEKKQLFLRVLVDGKATLYSYSSTGAMQLFFYQLDTTAVAQLVYKRYLIDAQRIQENNAYKQQLWTSLKCTSLTLEQFNHIRYSEKNLISIFTKYNDCAEATFTNYTDRKQKGTWNIAVKGGANFFSATTGQTLVVENYNKYSDEDKFYGFHSDLDRRSAPQVGIEVEYNFPFQRRKWSFFSEPTLQLHDHEYEVKVYKPQQTKAEPFGFSAVDATLQVKLTRISVPMGFKHYLNLSKSSSMFLKVGIAFDIINKPYQAVYVTNLEPIKWSTKYTPVKPIQHKNSTVELAPLVGLGYRHKTGISFEAIYLPFSDTAVYPKAVFGKTQINDSYSLSFGYRLYKTKS